MKRHFNTYQNKSTDLSNTIKRFKTNKRFIYFDIEYTIDFVLFPDNKILMEPGTFGK